MKNGKFYFNLCEYGIMLQIYTGNGKGKTTAAFGLAFRAHGRGKKVAIIQFVKPNESGEFKVAKSLGILIAHYGYPGFIIKEPRTQDYEQAKIAWERAKEIIQSEKYDIVILDELNIAFFYKLLNVHDVIDFIKNYKEKMEIVVTGRYAPQEIIDLADLVTEMKEIKHYYVKGVNAREGIEF